MSDLRSEIAWDEEHGAEKHSPRELVFCSECLEKVARNDWERHVKECQKREKRVKEYEVCIGDYDALMSSVRWCLEKGWALQGGISITSCPAGMVYAQAVVKME